MEPLLENFIFPLNSASCFVMYLINLRRAPSTSPLKGGINQLLQAYAESPKTTTYGNGLIPYSTKVVHKKLSLLIVNHAIIQGINCYRRSLYNLDLELM